MSAFDNATLMITGGTGSFGSTVLKHFLDSDLKEIRIFSRDEKKQDDMRHELQAKHPENAKKVKFYIGDVRNPQSIPIRWLRLRRSQKSTAAAQRYSIVCSICTVSSTGPITNGCCMQSIRTRDILQTLFSGSIEVMAVQWKSYIRHGHTKAGSFCTTN